MVEENSRGKLPGSKKGKYYPSYNYFVCSCDKDKELSPAEMAKHLKEDHALGDKAPCKREMMMHINRRPRHSMSFRWTVEKTGLEFYQYTG